MKKTCFLISTGLIALQIGLVNVLAADEVAFYELKKGSFSVKLTNLGATIASVILPDKNGKLADVVLGYDSVEGYKNNTSYFGSTVGRVANRIRGAEFFFNGTLYPLLPNKGKHMLHGGSKGFSNVVWKVKQHKNDSLNPHIMFGYDSSDGEEGFPGKLSVTVNYMLIGDYSLSITMKARALDKATPVNMAQHAYWNLGGHDSGDILDNEVQINGSRITSVDKETITTGEIESVKGTPYDFLEPRSVGSRIKELPNGYDINYILEGGKRHKLEKAAVVYHKESGRVMEVFTNQLGLQFYTSNKLQGVKGKGGYVYKPHAALCLETQGFPDAVHHPNFPAQIVHPRTSYQHLMLFQFSTKK